MAKNRVEKEPKSPLFGCPKSGVGLGSMAPKRAKNPLNENPIFLFGVLGRPKSLFLQGRIKYFCT